MKKLLLFCSIIFLLSSCSPTIHYLGESYPETEKIDIFYDENDVNQPFKVIGKIAHDKIVNYELERIKTHMIEKAKARGADGIIFDSFSVDRKNGDEGDRFSVKAKAIRYVK